MLNKKEFQQRAQRIEELVRNLDATADPNVRAAAKELVQALMDLQGACVERMLEIIHGTGEVGDALIGSFERDELVKNLMLLHGLHPVDLQTRIRQAIGKARQHLQTNGANVEIIAIDESGGVRLRLSGKSSHGCGSSFAALQGAIEEAIYESAPDIASLFVENAMEEQAAASGFIPLAQLAQKVEASGD